MKHTAFVLERLEQLSRLQHPKPPRVEYFRILKSEVEDPEPMRRPLWEVEDAD